MKQFSFEGTHNHTTVSGEDLEQARKDAACLLNVTVEQTIYLPELPPLVRQQDDQEARKDLGNRGQLNGQRGFNLMK